MFGEGKRTEHAPSADAGFTDLPKRERKRNDARLRAMMLWCDVEDLIVFFQNESRPTGIQRLSFEIFREVWKLGGASGLVRFCRHGVTETDYFVVDWPTLEAGILQASAGAALTGPDRVAPDRVALPPMAQMPAPVRPDLKSRLHRYWFPRITPMVRTPISAIYRAQKETLLALRDLIRALSLVAADPGAPPAKLGKVTIRLSTERVRFQPDDIFVSLGASWVLPNAAPGRYVQKRYGMRFAVLIHDLIPDLYPEWTSQPGLPLFRAWLHDVVPYADVIFSNSRHTAQDLLRRMAERGQPVATPVVLPIGHFPLVRHPSKTPNPFDRPFVLFVSTIEVRKNHALLFRVWRRLLADLPAAQIPYLVFAGKTGWLTGDLMVQLENTDLLDGHIKLVDSPSEVALAALYEACEFTVFPSLYEGWGLPVTESLSFGKTVAASNSAAIPEAGGAFCSYFDPENVSDAYAVIRGLIENPERVRQLEARIAAEFRPPSWADTAAALLAHLQALGPADYGGVSPMVALTLA